MNYEKAVYFVTKEKKVQHIGFTTPLSQIHLLESRELLEQHGFKEDPSLTRKTSDSVYMFSSFLPESVIDIWFGQILNERLKFKNLEKEKENKNKKREKEKKERKGKEREKRKRKREKEKKEKAQRVKKPARTVKKSPSKLRLIKPKRPSPTTDVKRIQSLQSLNQKKELPRTKPPKRTKTPDMLKEEVKAQRRWESFVPTCGECVFWEKQFLKFTEVEIGACSVTGNFVSREKKACSEFERQ